jgi:hypothetical protein
VVGAEDPTQINSSLGRFARVPTLTELERFAYLEILRLVASVHTGEVSAHDVLRMLARECRIVILNQRCCRRHSPD